MRAYIQPGKTLDWLNNTAAKVLSGQTVRWGSFIGISTGDIEVGTVGTIDVSGVYKVAKLPAAVIANGDALAFRPSTGQWLPESASAAGDVIGGAIAVEAAINGATVVKAHLYARPVTVK